MRPALVLLLLAPALSGCTLAPAAATVLAPAAAATTVARLHQGPCTEQFLAIPLPMVEAQGLAPAGFPPLPFDAAGKLPPNPLMATEVTVGYRCARTTGDGVDLGEVRTIGRALVVDPPAQYRDPAIKDYVIVFGGWTSSAELAAIYTSWSLPEVRVGTVDFAMAQDAPFAWHSHVRGASDQGSLEIDAVMAGVEEDQQPDAFRLFVFDHGALAGWVDWSWPAGARTIESGASVQVLSGAGAPEALAGVAFNYFGAYSYDLAFTSHRAP